METGNKKIYMVYTDPYTDGYGSEIYLAGVFENEVEAYKRVEEVLNEMKIAYEKKFDKAAPKYVENMAWVVPVELNKCYSADKAYGYDPFIEDEDKKADYVYIGGYCE